MSNLLPNLGPTPSLGPGSNPLGYPEGSTSPNLNLNLSPMARSVADNFAILDNLLTGSLVPPKVGSPGTFFFSAGHEDPAICAVAFEPAVVGPNNVNAYLFSLSLAVLVNKVSIYVGVGAPGATFNAGIYSMAGVKLLDSGPMAASGSGVVVVSANTAMNVLLQGGAWYYYAFSCTSGTPTFLAQNQNNIQAYIQLRGGTPRGVIASTQLSGGVLPATLGNIPTLAPAEAVYHPTVLFASN
jgi:hypothetical protein